jgi:hypothetical protein
VILTGKKQARMRCFLKKEAKTLAFWHAAGSKVKPLNSKIFLVLFFKKERLLCWPAGTSAAARE